jgi:carboxymethylenebutenolidase
LSAFDATSLVVRPDGPGPHAGVVLGAEAYGVHAFMRELQVRLAEQGFASALPDYYRGHGPATADYEDFTEVMRFIANLDFTQASSDLAASVDVLRRTHGVDPSRIAVWGYCTGATLAWLAACRRGDLGAAVLFFPSQPRFAEHGPKSPVDPMDLIWQISCPTLLVLGDQDGVWPPELISEFRARAQQWGVDVEVSVYAGAGHAFNAPEGPMRHEEADQAAWTDALAFLRRHLDR